MSERRSHPGSTGRGSRSGSAKSTAPAADGSRDAALRRYREKRDFTRTAEPQGAAPGEGAGPVFVVQQHAARRLHYDVRLEADGVLKSWAVPKGPSDDPTVKRLAVRTEDHPVEYADFEGVIPAGEYGGGEVIVWDTGTYRNLTEHRGTPVPVADAVERGHVAVWLEGQKLHGGYALTRLPAGRRGASGRSSGDTANGRSWLMVKMRDGAVAQLARSKAIETALSVRSGRTLADVAADPTARTWRSNRTNVAER